ncbi:ubiquitin thioesterase OTUB1 [Dermacentor silvarum]|uniref:ubiquitin thioesterase OTUB1 n=1 Tax=Dermacentor silvarum TaxID=543639 RepID=UPI0021019251|nr:ubiquitin thioesterase OTUB1 [Dermacentor silvarum]
MNPSNVNMADDVRQAAPKSPSNNVISDINHDEAILAQEKEIEREIAERIPLVDTKQDLSILEKEYALDDEVYQQKVKDLRSKYQSIRKTRPDGNCFFRAFSFAYLESLLSDQQEYTRFKQLAENSKEVLVSLGFQRFTIEDFHDTFMDVLKRIENNITLDDLLKIFNDQGYSDYIVVYMRLLTSGQLQKEASFFASFIDGQRTVQEFCKQAMEPMYKESDHIHVISLTRNLGVGVRIQYMDRGIGGKVNTHDFPEDREPRIHLLYRPGHYDILYHT